MNLLTNLFSIFVLGITLLICDVFFGVLTLTRSYIEPTVYGSYGALGIETTGSIFQETEEKINEFVDVLHLTFNFVGFLLVGYAIFSSFFTRATPLNFLLGFIAAIIIGAIINFVFIFLYNTMVTSLSEVSPYFTFSLGSYIYSNFTLILISTIFAGAASFLYSSVSTRFNKGGLSGL